MISLIDFIALNMLSLSEYAIFTSTPSFLHFFLSSPYMVQINHLSDYHDVIDDNFIRLGIKLFNKAKRKVKC